MRSTKAAAKSAGAALDSSCAESTEPAAESAGAGMESTASPESAMETTAASEATSFDRRENGGR
jgi:hypothetical protein